ncbi:MAG: Rieske 2Fe-2S domain-containing protein [Methylacidiphilales bacterium]|nr:Rieske 2Fe-2S domain-containing protein [Candidatus Methylacidiphilales bacterium]MDW8349415.1 Rieske 2Fe-2S domain-containing protein [Verrucomicrobiae bacterium]
MKMIPLSQDQLPPLGAATLIETESHRIALFRTSSGLYALDDHCPHRDGPLHQGTIENDCVTCPWHLWQFRLTDGRCTNVSHATAAKTYRIVEKQGEFFIQIED